MKTGYPDTPRVILITGNFPPRTGGIADYLGLMAEYYPPDALKVIALPTLNWQNFDRNKKYPIQRLKLPGKWDRPSSKFKYLGLFYYLQLTQEKNFHYIVCGEAHPTLMIPAWLIRKQRDIPYAVFTYGAEILRRKKFNSQALYRRLLSDSKFVFTISQRSRETTELFGVSSQKIHILHPNVNLQKFNPNIDPEAIRRKYNLLNKKCILSVGRLVERKGHDLVIMAMPEIIKAIPNAHYMIVGSGVYEPELKRMTQALNLSSYVTFTGYIPDDELASYYACCDVFVMLSREIQSKADFEGFGIVYLEANYFKKPVIGGQSGGIRDAIIDGTTGLLVNPHSHLEVAQAILRLLSDPLLAARLGQAGHQRVLDEFSGDNMARKLVDILSAN